MPQPSKPFSKHLRLAYSILGILAALALVLYAYRLPVEKAAIAFQSKSYYIVVVTLLLYVVSALWKFRKVRLSAKKAISTSVTAIALSLLTLPWHFSETHSFKIVNDESLLAGTAYLLEKEKLPASPIRGYKIGEQFTIVETFIDKRPLLYPVVLSIVHDLAGNRPTNAFWLNGLLAAALCIATYSCARNSNLSRISAWAISLLLCSVPLLGRSATSGGFETMNLLFIVLLFLATTRFAKSPDSNSLILLATASLLAAQVRYESAFMLLPLAILSIQAFLRRAISFTQLGTVSLLVAFLSLPMIWQNTIRQSRDSFSKAYVDPDTATFSIGNFADNLPEALSFLFSFNQSVPNAFALAAIGCICAIAFPFLLCKGRKWKESTPCAFAITWSCLAGMCVLILFFFFAKFENPLTQRLSLPFFLLFAMSIIGALSLRPLSNRMAAIFLAISGCAWAWSAYEGSIGVPTATNYDHAKHEILRANFIQAHRDESYLVIDPYSTIWLSHEVPAITYNRFNERLPMVHFHEKKQTYDNVYLFLDYIRNDSTGQTRLRDNCAFPDGIKLEFVFEEKVGPSGLVRIAKIVEYPEEAKKLLELFEIEMAKPRDPALREELRKGLWSAYLP